MHKIYFKSMNEDSSEDLSQPKHRTINTVPMMSGIRIRAIHIFDKEWTTHYKKEPDR